MLLAVPCARAAEPVWSRQGMPTPQATQLRAILRAADDFGLRPADYAVADGTDDAELTRAATRFITHLHYGRVDPRAAGFELQPARNDLDVAAAVLGLSDTSDVAAAITRIEPAFDHYRLLKVQLRRYRLLAADPSLTVLPPPGRRALHAGDGYAGAPALRRLLTALGDLPPEAVPDDGQTIDTALVTGLSRFQERHGISVDGHLGALTFAALTVPLAQRVRQIELTLERWRWLPPFDTPPIIVNIPQFRLFAFRSADDSSRDILQMPVIVGQAFPRTRTPVFVGELKYVVFRPYWDVPRSITVREMLPEIHAHADYLQRNNLELVDGQGDDGTVVAANPAGIAALAAGRLRLRQRPGADNALGLVKFLFPNAHNVYMHSTPAHRLFEQSRRAFSHGCIRLSDPLALAVFVLQQHAAGSWDEAAVTAAMNGALPQRVELREPIRVMVLYGTALATEAGPLQFFDDIYGHDRRLEALLGLRPVHVTAPTHWPMIGT